MFRSSRPLDNPINWSFRIGRLWDIDIRVHVTFVIGALVIAFDEWKAAPLGHVAAGLARGLGAAGMLFLIVLVHEFGHCWGARRVGGDADEVLLWPLGGLASVRPPHNAAAHLITAVCGPIVHPILCAIAAAVLIVLTARLGAVPWNPLHPCLPAVAGIFYTEPQSWVAYFFGINYTLLLFNLVPMYPLDGGRIFQALLWPRMGFVRSTELATGIGMVGALALGVFGLVTNTWMTVGLAVFGYLTCLQMRQAIKAGAYWDDGGTGYDFSKGYRAFDERAAGRQARPVRLTWLARHRARKALERERREAASLEARRRQVDEILLKVHREGIHSLTSDERRLLTEETERQRTDHTR